MTTRKSAKRITLIITAICLFFLSSCGTTTGNSLVMSEAFSPTETFLARGMTMFPTSAPDSDSGFISGPGGPLVDFRLCVKKVRLVDASGNTKAKDGEEDIVFNAGLIDLTSGAAVNWGAVEVPTGFELARLYIQLQRDDANCPGLEAAMKVNEYSVDSNIVLKFRFSPAIEFAAGDTLALNVQTLARGLLTLANEGSLHSGNLKQSAEQIEESAQKKGQ